MYSNTKYVMHMKIVFFSANMNLLTASITHTPYLSNDLRLKPV